MSVYSRKLLEHLPKSLTFVEYCKRNATLLLFGFIFVLKIQVIKKMANKEHASIHFHSPDVNTLCTRTFLSF